jgi:hypothetical protein
MKNLLNFGSKNRFGLTLVTMVAIAFFCLRDTQGVLGSTSGHVLALTLAILAFGAVSSNRRKREVAELERMEAHRTLQQRALELTEVLVGSELVYTGG